MKSKPKTKRFSRRHVNFESPVDQELWLRGQLSASTSELIRITGETKGQVMYRLRVLKDTLGLNEAVRARWRNGHHPLFARILRDYRSVMLADLRRNVIPKLVRPTPETVKIDL